MSGTALPVDPWPDSLHVLRAPDGRPAYARFDEQAGWVMYLPVCAANGRTFELLGYRYIRELLLEREGF